MSFMDKAKDAVDKVEDKIPGSVKDKIPEGVKDALGIDEEPDAGGATDAGSATDPGSVSPVAAGTTNDAADRALKSSSTGYTDAPDGKDDHVSDAPGAGRGSVSDLNE